MGEKDTFNEAVGKALRSARLRAGFDNQRTAASRLGTSPAALSRYEGGSRQAGYNTLHAMAETYGTSIGDFFADAEEIQRASDFVSGETGEQNGDSTN